MKIIHTVAELQEALATPRQTGKRIGLVPTMGALHEGHLSLIHRARAENDIVVVSVFVNPIQFNNPEDLAKYPRTVEADCAKLAEAQADIAFVPSVEEMYPEPVTDVYHFGPIEEVMEGPRRPGHFSGVAVVLRRLFDLVQPQRAYFGEKDYQQIAIVRNLIEQIKYPIEIVPCPIVRADDGLALSSRNMRLSPAARAIAPRIYATLKEAVTRSQTASVEEVKQWVLATLREVSSDDPTLINADTQTVFDPEYFEIVDDTTLQPIRQWSDARGVVGCITVWLTGVRLIDMIRFR
ncbi:MAG: pantoate--beta-alanine ligase [Bacteroidales bacterium]|nr:pantoate--beta-alanine ligase [Bacteroidales bacterium]